ncbi:oxygen-insensitive NADPH nitroreductase [Paenibacillus pini]|uniref:Nitroreductase n=1 Tax=Paenibacillus pini JCM 16418 TaxID=1236976 RepID=W7Z677_9BACL|nr:oxygen-insensitive NADPH nitroreductase [Paenibacillus pini]GAF09834.1 nitroreductase [Paenibacillus pini JCM 16418]
MNDIITQLMSHRSIRKFTNDPITKEQLHSIIAAGQMASSSSNVQAFSVIAATDPELKKKLAVLAGNQAYVEQCSVFLVWCADLYRLQEVTSDHLKEANQSSHVDTTENFIVATVDAALAAQNAAVAAESMGLGIVYIGGVRNRIAELSELLGLPELVYPVFGMCVGVPDQEPGLRPRLPVEAVLHENGYNKEQTVEQVKVYDGTMKRYLEERTNGAKDTPWSQVMADRLAEPIRLHMREFLDEKGFMKR